MTFITDVTVRRILDSRGRPTIEAEVATPEAVGRAAAPSGASTGKHEVAAWPEGGVVASLRAARTTVIPALLDLDATDQGYIDATLEELDGTPNFRILGGNLATAISLATARAGANSLGIPLFQHLGGAFPQLHVRPFGNVLGGGAHAIGGTSIQEFMAVSLAPTATEAVFANAEAHAHVGKILKEKLPGIAIGKGDEGAWVAPIEDEEALAIVGRAVEEVSSDHRFPVRIALDVAATELWTGKAYKYRKQQRSAKEQLDFMARLAQDHDLFSIEDPFHEEDFEAFAELTERVGEATLVVADDLTTTNPERVQHAIDQGAGNALLVKVNQIGTLSRAVESIRLAHEAGWATIVSHRSGETTDDSIAHIAAAFGCLGLKTGAVGGERTAKLNELLRIEELVRGPPPEPSPERTSAKSAPKSPAKKKR